MKKLLCLLGMMAGFNAFAVDDEAVKIWINNNCKSDNVVTATIDNRQFYLLYLDSVLGFIQNGVLISHEDFPTFAIIRMDDEVWIEDKCYKINEQFMTEINFQVTNLPDFKTTCKVVPEIKNQDLKRCN